MAYREKLAALNLTAMALVYAVYFVLVAARPPVARLIDMLWLFGPAALTHAALVIAGSAALALQAGRAGRGPPDERDRAIARRGGSVGYLVLLGGMIVTGVVMPFSDPPAKIVNTALFAIVTAEITRYALILASYRRGWHG